MERPATTEEIRNHSVNTLLKNHPNAFALFEDGGKKLGEEFIKNKLHNFPALCREARKINYEIKRTYEQMGNPQGWSGNKDFKFDYTIPKELYAFMVNMVYRNFWDEENEKIWRPFMKGIMNGVDPMEQLHKVKVYYGAVNKHVE